MEEELSVLPNKFMPVSVFLQIPEAPPAAVPALAGVLDYLELTCHLPEGVESSVGTQVA